MKRRRPSTWIVLLDSRSRQPGTTISNPTFQLTHPLGNVSSCRVRCVQFANVLHNIDSTHNVVGLVGKNKGVVPPGFYTPNTLVDSINSFGIGIGISVTYTPASNALHWDVGDGVIDTQNSSMRETLGLNVGQVYTGSFTTTLFMASPMNIDFVSPQLQTSNYSYSGRDTRRDTNRQPLVSVPVLNGHGQMSVYMPTTLHDVHIGGGQFGQLEFTVVDSLTGRELNEMSHWSMQLEFFCE